MNDAYISLNQSEIFELLQTAPYGTLAVADSESAWAVPMFYQAQLHRGIFTVRMKTDDVGTKMEMLHENAQAFFSVTARRAGRYESVLMQGPVAVEAASCGCRGKVELILTAQEISGRRYEKYPCDCTEDPNRGRRAPEYEPQPKTAQTQRDWDKANVQPQRRQNRFEQEQDFLQYRQERQEHPCRPERAAAPKAAQKDRDAPRYEQSRPFARESKREQPRRVYRCQSSEMLDRLWHKYGEKDPECTALKLAQSTPTELAAGAVAKQFERVRESDVAVFREKTGHMVFKKNGVYRLRARAKITDAPEGRLRLALWCENGRCLVERLPFRAVDCDHAEMESQLVFEVDDSHYAFTLKNDTDADWEFSGIFLFEKIR